MMLNRVLTVICLFILSACSSDKQESLLDISLVYQQQSLTCGDTLSIAEQQWQLSQLQFFVANIEFEDAQGLWQNATLQVTPHQTAQVALIGQNCVAQEQGNWQLRFDPVINFAGYRKMRFQLGVPFELNHLNPLTQTSPLNVSSMFWVWQTGHKFLRLEMHSDTDNWLFHLGSTGCQSPSVMRSPSQACRYPNRYTFELSLDGSQQIELDLAPLIAKLDLSLAASCQSEHDNAVCQQLFAHLSQGKNEQIFRVSNAQ